MPPAKWQWEYLFLDIDVRDRKAIEDGLNAFGDDSWEFTGHVVQTARGASYLMKRRKM